MKARLVIAAAFLAITVAPLRAATITVTSTADSGPGSLRYALASAADGDTIDASSITGTILLTNGELLVTNSVDIVGPGPDLLAVSGNRSPWRANGSRVFHVAPSNTVIISSLTVTNGGGPEIGGGIYNDHSMLVVTNCVVTDNSAASPGGGIYNDGESFASATLTVVNSTLTGNRGCCDGGGAIYNDAEGNGTATVDVVDSRLIGNYSTERGGGIFSDALYGRGAAILQIVNSELISNVAGSREGGAICNVFGDMTISNSTLRDNYAAEFGGGIFNGVEGRTTDVQIVNSTLSGNSADLGGGIYNSSGNGVGFGNLEVANSTISSNSAYVGGGMYNDGGTLRILNSTLNENSATNSSGIYNTSWANLEIGSTILNAGALGGTITNVSGTVTSLGYNLSSDDGGGFLTATGDQTNTDPMLDPAGLQDNGGPTLTIALLCGSPAIDQGYNFSGSTTDQRGNGFVRTFDDCAVPNAPGGDGTDIGAYEVQLGQCPHPPIMSCPTNQSVNARSSAGARVNYPTPVASNGCPVTVVCNPPSGSRFAIGNTTVSCLATDSEGNEATCSFTIHVKGAAEQINDLIVLVQRLDLKPWPTYVLTAELQSASNALRRGNTRAACFDLDTFIFDVDAQSWWGQIWPPARARLLVRNAQRIQNVLGCDHGFGPGHF
jgi:hypothetical protein